MINVEPSDDGINWKLFAYNTDAQALIDAINKAIESIPADYSSLLATIAPNYGDLKFPVLAGEYCWYSGVLYRAKSDIPSTEAWTAGHWAKAIVMDEANNMFRELYAQMSALHAGEIGMEYYEQGGLSETGADSTYNQSTRVRIKRALMFPEDVIIYCVERPLYFYVVDIDTETLISNSFGKNSFTIPAGTRFRFCVSSADGGTATGGEIAPSGVAGQIRYKSASQIAPMIEAEGGAFEKGSLLADGTDDMYFYTSRIRSRFIQTNVYDTTVKSAVSSARFIVYYYTPDGKISGSTTWTTSATIPKGSFFRLLMSLTPTAATETTIDEILAGFSFEYVADKEQLDALEQKITEISENMDSTGCSISGPDLWEKGWIDNGANSTWNQNSRIRMKSIAELDVPVQITSVSEMSRFAVSLYNASGAYTQTVSNCRWHKIPAKTKFRLAMYRQATDQVNAYSIEETLSDFTFAYGNSTIESRNEHKDHILNTMATTLSADREKYANLFTVAHASDLHVDTWRYKNFIDYINGRNGNKIMIPVVTGDMVNAPVANEFQPMAETDALSDRMIYHTVGNHDKVGVFDGTTYRNTLAALYGKNTPENPTGFDYARYGSGQLYYYKDFSQNTGVYHSSASVSTLERNFLRLIVLNEYDQDNTASNATYTQAQINWFIEALEGAQENDMAVVITRHTPETPEVLNNDKGFHFNGDAFEEGRNCSGTPIEDLVNAFRHGGTVNQTYTYSNGAPSITVNKTFPGGGHFVAYLCGHRHTDACGFSAHYTDQLYLVVACGCMRTLPEYLTIGTMHDQSDVVRAGGTISEDLFNVYAIDTERKLLKILRIGADVTDKMTSRLTAVFDYEGPASSAYNIRAEQINGDDYQIIMNTEVQ